MPGTRLDTVQQEMLDRILDSMERDGRGWTKGWSFDGFPVNGTTGRPYRGRNALLLWYQMYAGGFEDPRFVTFNQAKDAGLSVRKGSKSSLVERWKLFLVLRSDPSARVPQPKSRSEVERLVLEQPDKYAARLRPVGYWSVFNADQLDGDLSRLVPIPDRGRVAVDDALIDALESASPCPVAETLGDRACYSIAGDRITVPRRSQFSSTDSFARTLLHEMCHATGAAGRLGRDGFDPDAGPIDVETRALEELVAELGSLYTANALGLDLSSAAADPAGEETEPFENSVAYLKGWAARTGDAPGALMRQASKAADAQKYLVEKCFEPKLGKNLLRKPPEDETETLAVDAAVQAGPAADARTEGPGEEHLVSEESRGAISDLAAKAGWDVEILDTDAYDVHAVFSLPGTGRTVDTPFAPSGGLYGAAEAFGRELDRIDPADPIRRHAERLLESLGRRSGRYEGEPDQGQWVWEAHRETARNDLGNRGFGRPGL